MFEGGRSTARSPLAFAAPVTTVFQRPVVLDRSVRANLAYGLRVRGAAATSDRRIACSTALGARRPGGAPVAHACRAARSSASRSVVRWRSNPEVLLLDEPTANLDPHNVRLIEDVDSRRQARGVTIVLATHQVFQARRLADRTALLLDGRIVEIAPTASCSTRPAILGREPS